MNNEEIVIVCVLANHCLEIHVVDLYVFILCAVCHSVP